MPLIQGENLVKIFGIKKGLFSQQAALRAVDDVSLSIEEGETLALVGESGSGKSTLGRLLLGLAAPSSGQILYEGNALAGLKGAAWRNFRAEVHGGGLPNLHLACAIPNTTWYESLVRTNPIIVEDGIGPDGCISPPDVPGIGWDAPFGGPKATEELTEQEPA